MRILSFALSESLRDASVVLRAIEGREIKMKRALLFALMLVAVLAPFAGTAHADLKSDQAIPQAP